MDLKAWAKMWVGTGKKLKEIRRKEIQSLNTFEAIESFNQSFRWAMASAPKRINSGLVEQQRIFKKLRKP